MNKKILFIHIPKTAGTSFRIAASDYFGAKHTFYDYGKQSEETSIEILNFIYKHNEPYSLLQRFKESDNVFLSGHYNVAKYMHLFDTLDVITFVRNPIKQVVSHYYHFKTHHNYKGTLYNFIKEDRFKNIQSKFLKGKPLELFGFVGITEEYEKSLSLINSYYGIDIKALKMNTNQMLKEEISDEVVRLIEEENVEDIKLYKRAKEIFDKRVECFNQNIPYKHIWIEQQTKYSLKGVAFVKDDNSVTTIDMLVDNKPKKLYAKHFRMDLLHHRVPRDGFVGFEYQDKDNKEVVIL